MRTFALLFVLLLSSSASAKPAVKWLDDGPAHVGVYQQCQVVFGDVARTTRADAELVVNNWFTANAYLEKWCAVRGISIALKRSADGQLYAEITPEQADYYTTNT